MKTHTIIILPDGETWNTISDITPIAEISLTSLTDMQISS